MQGKRDFSFNAERIVSLLNDAVARVQSEEDPDEMNELKKLFKKTVPFSRRAYVSAYLAKMLTENRPYRRPMRDTRERFSRDHSERPYEPRERMYGDMRPSYERRPRYQSDDDIGLKSRPIDSMGTKPPVPRAVIAPEFAKTIFISIGRNRRVFARDLIALISQAGGVEREKIGDIKVYDNYSFITLFAEDATKVIELLDGYEYRGRKLSVSYSRKKEDLYGANQSDFAGGMQDDFAGENDTRYGQNCVDAYTSSTSYGASTPNPSATDTPSVENTSTQPEE